MLLVSMLKSWINERARLQDRYVFNFLSPAFRSLRVADGFVRNVFVLTTGTTIAMVIPVVAAPVLTRLYTPQDYGIFALYVALVSVLSVPISANYESAVMLPERDGDALNLVALCLVIALLLSTVLLLVLWPLTGRITTLLGNRHIAAYLHLVPLMVFMLGVYQALSFWANRRRQFRWLAANRIAESLATPLLSVFLGLCSLGVGGLIWALLSGKAVAVSMLARRIWQEKRKERVPLKRALMLEQGRKYYDFPVYSAPASFLDVVALQIPVLLLTKSFGPTVVGLFALTTRVAGAPMALIAGCVGQVYYQWIAEARHREEDSPHLFRVAGYLALIVLGPLVALVLFAPPLFSFVFGAQWGVAGEYARILVFPLAVKFVVSPLGMIMPASGNVRLGSVWKIINFFTTSVTLYVASHFGVKTFLYAYGCHEVVLWTFYFSLILRASKGLRSAGQGKTGPL